MEQCKTCLHAAVCGKCAAMGGNARNCKNYAEEKRGRWEKVVENEMYWYECSECGADVPKTRWKHDYFSDYCPNCGAYMDGVSE